MRVYIVIDGGENAKLMIPETIVITDVAVNPPSTVVAVIVADPTDTAVTRPVLLTVAVGPLLVHVIALFVAFDGDSVATSCFCAPTVKLTDVVSREMPVTGILIADTVTEAVAENPPSAVRAVIVAEPAAIAVTSPVLLTVADADELVHITALFVAFAGVMVAMSCCVSPIIIFSVVIFRVMPDTGTDATTVIKAVAVNPPSAVRAIIFVEPTDTPVTRPTLSQALALGRIQLHSPP